MLGVGPLPNDEHMFVFIPAPRHSARVVQNFPTPSAFPLSPGCPHCDRYVLMSAGFPATGMSSSPMSSSSLFVCGQAESSKHRTAHACLFMRTVNHAAHAVVNRFRLATPGSRPAPMPSHSG